MYLIVFVYPEFEPINPIKQESYWSVSTVKDEDLQVNLYSSISGDNIFWFTDLPQYYLLLDYTSYTLMQHFQEFEDTL